MLTSRRLTAAFPVAALLFALLPVSLAAATGPSTVTVRVLGAAPAFQTLLASTEVTTTTARVEKNGGSCTGTSAAGALELATKGNWEGTWNSGFGDYEVISIESQSYPFEPASNKNYFWSLWLNGTEAQQGICGSALETGAEVLFFPSCFGSECPAAPDLLEFQAPTVAEVGSISVTVLSHPAAGGAAVPAAGARVSSEGTGATTDSSGQATLTFSHAGTYPIHAAPATDHPNTVPAEALICVHVVNDGECGTRAPVTPSGTTSASGATPEGGVKSVLSTGPHALVARVTGLLEGHVYRRRSAPRLLRGAVAAHAALRDVQLRLTRRQRRKCAFYDGLTERFRAMRCGAEHGAYFSVGDHASFSYLLPAALARGRYVLDIAATDVAGNHTALARGTSRIVFYVA